MDKLVEAVAKLVGSQQMIIESQQLMQQMMLQQQWHTPASDESTTGDTCQGIVA